MDAERGVVLRLECRIGGLPFSVDEMTAVAFDEPLADDLFRLDLLPGEQVEDARATSPRRVPIEEAARQAPFTVLLPRRVPEGAQMHVVLGPPWFGADDDTEVRIHYFLPDARHHLHLYETAARRPYPDDLEGERLERDGQVLHVWDPWDPHGAKGGLPRQVWLDRDGTRVQIQSDLRLDTLIEVALSLAPASTEPPRLFPAG